MTKVENQAQVQAIADAIGRAREEGKREILKSLQKILAKHRRTKTYFAKPIQIELDDFIEDNTRPSPTEGR